MRTEFTPQQLEDPALAQVNAILRKCVRCGFCNTACPTFALSGDELDGPRGRIYLLKNLLEGNETPSAKVTRHLDRCLSCLSCMTACPSGVNYMRLIDPGRAYLENRARRPWADRLFRSLLAALLPYPGRFRLLLLLAGLAAPVRRLLPGRWRNALALRPSRPLRAPAPPPDERDSPVPTGAPHAPASSETMNGNDGAVVGLAAGCVQQVLGNHINAAAGRLLQRHGCRVRLLSEPACCGAIEHHLGKEERARQRLRRNTSAWMRQADELGLEAVLVAASGCGAMLKDYGRLLRFDDALAADAARLSRMTWDIAQFLVRRAPLPGNPQSPPLRVAYQSPCAMLHGQKIDAAPVALLRQAGFTVLEPAEKHLCCGSAGVYNLLQPAPADALGKRKAAQLTQLKPQVIASGNLGCMTQLRRFTATPLLHTVELLDWAAGGPRPFSL